VLDGRPTSKSKFSFIRPLSAQCYKAFCGWNKQESLSPVSLMFVGTARTREPTIQCSTSKVIHSGKLWP
jgi:hypothetical protein